MMLSSGDHPGDAERCRALGITAYLQKPIKQSELLDAIVVTLGKAASVPPALPASRVEAADDPAGLVVLLAEDNEVNQELAIAILERRGCHVVLARNGREAVALWEREPFDLVLMDVQMPDMDGLRATQAIRALEKTRGGVHTPIIAVTAHAMEGDRERCLAAGMDGYVSKPLRVGELFQVVAALLPQRETPTIAPMRHDLARRAAPNLQRRARGRWRRCGVAREDRPGVPGTVPAAGRETRKADPRGRRRRRSRRGSCPGRVARGARRAAGARGGPTRRAACGRRRPARPRRRMRGARAGTREVVRTLEEFLGPSRLARPA